MIDIKKGIVQGLEHFFDIAVELLCIADFDGRIEKLNQEWESSLGYTLGEIKEKGLYGTLLPQDSRLAAQAVSNAKKTGKKQRFEARCLRKDIAPLWLEWRLLPVEDLIYISARDISERKRGELLLKESETRFRNMLDKVNLVGLLVDKEGRIEFLNKFAVDFTGYSQEEIYKKNIIELLILENHQKENFTRLLETGEVPEFFVSEIAAKDKSIKTLSWSVSTIIDENNRLLGAACFGEDITELRIYESIINFRYNLIEKENNDDINTLIEYTLETAEKLTGSKISVFRFYNQDDHSIILQAASPSLQKDPILMAMLGTSYKIESAGIWSDCLKERKPVIHNNFKRQRTNAKLPAGHPEILRDLVCPIIRDDKIVAVLSLGNKESDYTQKDIEIVSLLSDSLWNLLYKKKMTDALKESEEKLRSLNVTKDRFFSIIAHDLKSPFQGLLGSMQILTSEFDYLSDSERKTLITSIEKLSRHTYKLLENLLEWSRIQTEHLEYNIQIFNIKNAFQDTIELLSNVAANKGINVKLNIPEDYFAKSDINVTLTVFRNILSNAIKFTGQNGIITISAFQSNGFIEISVEDNGIGMTKEEVDNLFLIQNQQNRPGTEGETGTGLGLILCKDMIERVGGEIRVTSTPGKGTLFTFSVPTI